MDRTRNGRQTYKSNWTRAVAMVLVSLFLSGCLSSPVVLLHPKAPVVLLKSVVVEVAVEDPPGSGLLVYYGHTTLEAGQTVFWAEWEELPGT